MFRLEKLQHGTTVHCIILCKFNTDESTCGLLVTKTILNYTEIQTQCIPFALFITLLLLFRLLSWHFTAATILKYILRADWTTEFIVWKILAQKQSSLTNITQMVHMELESTIRRAVGILSDRKPLQLNEWSDMWHNERKEAVSKWRR